MNLESQVIRKNGVYLTHTESIRRILVGMSDVEAEKTGNKDYVIVNEMKLEN